MPWYYNNSETTTSVEVGRGEVVCVQPMSYVFVENIMINKKEFMKLVSRNVLQRTGSPKRADVKKQIPVEPIFAEVEVGTDFSLSLNEGKDKIEKREEKVQTRRRRKKTT